MKSSEYNKVYEHIKSQIIGDLYAAGQKLPPERRICDQFAVSRITARHALRLLEDDGLVERFQGKGTFVKSVRPAKLPITDSGFAKSVKQYAPGLYRKLLRHEVSAPTSEISNILCLNGQQCFTAARADILDHQTIAFDKAYIIPEYCGSITEELLIKIDFFERWIEIENIKVSHYSQTIEAVEADKEIATILNIAINSAALRSTEIYYDDNNKAFAVFKSCYRGDKVKLTSTVSYRGRNSAEIVDL